MMADFKYNGFSYELIIRPWKTKTSKYEAIRWVNGLRNLWGIIPYDEYLKIKSLI